MASLLSFIASIQGRGATVTTCRVDSDTGILFELGGTTIDPSEVRAELIMLDGIDGMLVDRSAAEVKAWGPAVTAWSRGAPDEPDPDMAPVPMPADPPKKPLVLLTLDQLRDAQQPFRLEDLTLNSAKIAPGSELLAEMLAVPEKPRHKSIKLALSLALTDALRENAPGLMVAGEPFDWRRVVREPEVKRTRVIWTAGEHRATVDVRDDAMIGGLGHWEPKLVQKVAGEITRQAIGDMLNDLWDKGVVPKPFTANQILKSALMENMGSGSGDNFKRTVDRLFAEHYPQLCAPVWTGGRANVQARETCVVLVQPYQFAPPRLMILTPNGGHTLNLDCSTVCSKIEG